MHRKRFAACPGTALPLAVVIGFGVMGERLAGGDVAIAEFAGAGTAVAVHRRMRPAATTSPVPTSRTSHG